jgi:hypothetical protein
VYSSIGTLTTGSKTLGLSFVIGLNLTVKLSASKTACSCSSTLVNTPSGPLGLALSFLLAIESKGNEFQCTRALIFFKKYTICAPKEGALFSKKNNLQRNLTCLNNNPLSCIVILSLIFAASVQYELLCYLQTDNFVHLVSHISNTISIDKTGLPFTSLKFFHLPGSAATVSKEVRDLVALEKQHGPFHGWSPAVGTFLLVSMMIAWNSIFLFSGRLLRGIVRFFLPDPGID